MKKVLIIVGIFLFIGLISFIIYDSNKLKVDNTKFKLKNNEIEVFKTYKLSELFDEFNGSLENDYQIYEEELKNKTYEFLYKYKGKKKKGIINLDIVDKTPPVTILRNSYSVYLDYNDDLTNQILVADNYDNKLKSEIVGEYNYRELGNYNVIYKVTDSSGNVTNTPFTLKVIERPKKVASSSSYISFDSAIKKYKTDNTMIGLDISKWQQDIDFNKIKEAGCEFVFIRVGTQTGYNEDSKIDSYFKKNIEEAIKVGIKVGIYYYSYATNKDEAKKQALWVIDQIKDYKIDLPVVFDWESWSDFNSLHINLHNFNNMANEFLKTIEDVGYQAALYSSKYYLEKIWETNYPIWLAHYTDKTDYSGKYFLWQMCSDGRIDGIKGNVDIDILYK